MSSILLIDDEPEIRSSIARVLERVGHHVVVSESADSGLPLLEKNDFDLIIADLIMPGTNGVDAIKDVSKLHPEIKIIAISGGGNFGSASYQPNAISTTAYLEAAIEAGADFVLTKPFRSAALLEAVETVVEN